MLEKVDIEKIKSIALEASIIIMDIYNRDFSIEYKDDKSPVTEADIKSNEIICSRLKEFYPNIPIMSEESMQISYEERKKWEYYFCVDPIDGTKEFIKKSGEFTINIALIHNKTPVLGVIYLPTTNTMYSAKKGEGAFKNREKLPIKRADEKYVIVSSKSNRSKETDEFIDTIKVEKEKELIYMGSSIKFCLIAEGIADCYPRIGPTMEWDIAAGDAIVRETGKMIYHLETNETLVYNKKDLLNPNFLVK